MRAFAIDEFGAPGSLHELPDPTPEEGQVRVRVEAASINPADVLMLGGAYKDFMEHRFPMVPGLDLGGTVDAVGTGVDGLQVGDPVFGVHGMRVVGAGALAEFTIASAATIARRPPEVDAAFGAALSLAGVSALTMVETAEPQAGDVVLLIGAAGATPIAVTRAVNHDYVRGLGASQTIDYQAQDVFDTVRTAHPDGIAAIFDMVGDKEANARLAQLVRLGGHFASMAGGADVEALAARGITGLNVRTQATTEKLERLLEFVASGSLRRPEIRTFALADAGQALIEIAGRHVRGKLVIVP